MATRNIGSGDELSVESGAGIRVNTGATVADLAQTVGGARLRIASGTVTLDGSNPTSATTGLSGIITAVVGLKQTTAPGDDPSWLSCNYSGTSGSLDIYAWKNTGGTDPSLVASTDSTATVDWIAVGL